MERLALVSYCVGAVPDYALPAAAEPEVMVHDGVARAPRKTTRKRARNAEGHFQADDPATPEVDEAWEN